MTKRMLIDGTHAEETRVVVLDGNRLEDFDVETSTKKQLKGNIYLAKIVRVEPSLQAAFVEYGGARHGFLAFGEIHPDYYQIPVADRQRLIAQQEEEAREAEAAEDAAAQADEAAGQGSSEPAYTDPLDEPAEAEGAAPDTASDQTIAEAQPAPAEWPVTAEPEPAEPEPEPAPAEPDPVERETTAPEPAVPEANEPSPAQAAAIVQQSISSPEIYAVSKTADEDTAEAVAVLTEMGLHVAADGEVTGDPQAMAELADALDGGSATGEDAPAEPPPETLGGETEQTEEREHRQPARYLRNYKIQEVIRRRQIMLVQVVKEERGGKGAALTTYISLAGRFCVLMPNSPRGGGISRKITSATDRRRLKEITTALDIPSGMGLIVRTAGAARPAPEITRDCEYLLQLWDDIRDTTLKSAAPAAIYEEASLIKRAIRDVYSRDVDEVLVDGQAAWLAARDQMRLLMPSHAPKVQLWQEGQPLFAHHQVDAQLDAMLSPTVQLRSGGYLVINQTEALVAIDVNSGRSTRERGIEETALRTNMEAAEEVARQLRLRDLAGLIVIDFIDMEARKHNGMVERKLKDSLKNDRARIQLGSISHFGLLEMSRQRLRPSFAETSFVQCPHCTGTGLVRSTEGAAIHVLRAIEEEGGKRRSAEIMVNVAGPIAMYILNHKRARLAEIESQYGMDVLFTPDPTLLPPAVKIDRVRSHAPGEAPPPPARLAQAPVPSITVVENDADLVFDDEQADEALAAPAEAQTRNESSSRPRVYAENQAHSVSPAHPESQVNSESQPQGDAGEAGRRRRRRRRRGGRREDGPRDEVSPHAEPGAEQPELPPLHGVDPDSVTPLAAAEAAIGQAPDAAQLPEPGFALETGEGGRKRNRNRGRRRGKDGPGGSAPIADDMPQGVPAYTGPTPADPFGGGSFDIFDAIEQAEAQAAAQVYVKTAPPAEPASPEPAPPAAVFPEPVLPESVFPEPVLAEPMLAEALASGSVVQPEPVSPEPEPEAVAPETPIPAEPPPAPAKPARRSRAKPKPVATLPLEPANPELVAAALEPTPPEPVASEPEPPVEQPPAAGAEPASPEPLIKPVMVDDAPSAPKRGWWRR